MIVVWAVAIYVAISILVIWGSIYINRNIGFDESAGHIDGPLLLTPVKKDLGHYARDFLEFRERYDFAWETFEGLMVLGIFGLMMLDLGEIEYLASLISHVLVGILLVLKFASLFFYWRAQYRPQGLF